ncbi:MAG TPA: lysophospholipid acyltransferase family protein [Bacteroidota bacterium]|nr:lysophospholipid acyltransferase family protein [Bacteroidota bacterium]
MHKTPNTPRPSSTPVPQREDDWQFTLPETLYSTFIAARCLMVLALIFVVFLPLSFLFPKRVYDGWLRYAARFFLRCAGVRVRTIVGLEHIDPNEAYIVTPNHVNFLEPFIYQGYYPYLLRGVEKKENFRIPVWGRFMRAMGQIEIDREHPTKAIASMKEVERVLCEERTSVLILPEGTRTPDGRLQPFKRGPFKTAAEAQVKILPMCCKGLYAINRKGDWRIKPGEIDIVFGKPLGPPGPDIESQHEISSRLRAWMLEQLGQTNEP